MTSLDSLRSLSVAALALCALFMGGARGCGGDDDVPIGRHDAGPGGGCTPGDTMDDGCNTCTCSADGFWGCTARWCDDGGTTGGCDYGGVHYGPGDSFSDGCNLCRCGEDGMIACTLRDCAPVDGGAGAYCEYMGVRYSPGDTFSDGCNICGCGDDGSIACTARWCEPVDGGTSSCSTDSECTSYERCSAGACVAHSCATETTILCRCVRPDCGPDGVAVIHGGCWECVNVSDCAVTGTGCGGV